MNLRFHPEVQTDLRRALEYFSREGGPKLGDRFFEEVQATAARVEANPTHFGFLQGDLRKARLHVFRYHLLFRIKPFGVRILVLRHNRRHPEFGLDRR